MSWSVNAVGKPKAVAAKLAEAFSKNPCSEPEETIRQSVAGAIAAALQVYPDDAAVNVEANGSQSVNGSNPEKATNSLTVKIQPLFGFVE